MVRALASHQCGPSSIPRLAVICGLSLLVLYSAPRGFSPGSPVFPSPQKPTFDLICVNYLFQFTVVAVALRRRNTRYKNPQLGAQHCFVASLGGCLPFFTLHDQLVAQQKHVAG